MDDGEREYYGEFVKYLEESGNEKYLGAKEQIMGDRYTGDAQLQLLAQSVFMKYNPERGYEYDSAEPLSDELINSKKLVAIDCRGNRIIITKRLGTQPDQNVYEGILMPPRGRIREVVVKWLDQIDSDIQIEIDRWVKFKETGAQVPWFSGDFQIYGYKTLVLEKLKPISRSDNFSKVGIQIIDQLQKLHQFACHSDIKPENILKDDKGKYYLVDLGDISDTVLNYGYIRRAFTPLFTSQVRYNQTITTPKYDLLELGFVLNFLSFDTSGYRLTLFEMMNQELRELGQPEIQDWWRILSPNNPKIEQYYTILSTLSEVDITPSTYSLLSSTLR